MMMLAEKMQELEAERGGGGRKSLTCLKENYISPHSVQLLQNGKLRKTAKFCCGKEYSPFPPEISLHSRIRDCFFHTKICDVCKKKTHFEQKVGQVRNS